MDCWRRLVSWLLRARSWQPQVMTTEDTPGIDKMLQGPAGGRYLLLRHGPRGTWVATLKSRVTRTAAFQ
jgi:hypothetical protein